MPRLLWLALGLLLGLIVVSEIVEGHAQHLAVVAIGLLALAARLRFGRSRRILGTAAATIALATLLILAVGHWLDGRLELVGGVYGLALLLLAAGALASAVDRHATRSLPYQTTPRQGSGREH